MAKKKTSIELKSPKFSPYHHEQYSREGKFQKALVEHAAKMRANEAAKRKAASKGKLKQKWDTHDGKRPPTKAEIAARRKASIEKANKARAAALAKAKKLVLADKKRKALAAKRKAKADSTLLTKKKTLLTK